MGRRSTENNGPSHSDVELGENDRSDIDDRKRKPSSNPAVTPRATGTASFGPSTRSPNDLISSGSRRPVSPGLERWLRLLEVSSAPNSSTFGCGVYPNEKAPFMRESSSLSTRKLEVLKYVP